MKLLFRAPKFLTGSLGAFSVFLMSVAAHASSPKDACWEPVHDYIVGEAESSITQYTVYGPDLVTAGDAIEAMESNNMELPDDDIQSVKTFAKDRAVLFYIADYHSPVGDSAELFVVNKRDCKVLKAYLFFAE